ncbi:YeiH family protein [Zhouia sp. PK063]|uniref:YeiH family protein n=1 Tax=Zhouia sp. PK063 TaxID=3373602 RepID=UPI0037B2171E
MAKRIEVQHSNRIQRFFDKHISLREVVFIVLVVLCLSPLISPPVALVLGILIAQVVGHPYLHLNHKATHLLLQIAVVGLGFGMNVKSAVAAGKEGFLFTVGSIAFTLILGWVLSKWLKIEKVTSFLISCGTAICGGSAIAAVAPAIKAREKEISVALGVIFILNSVALVVFPIIGHWVGLSQTQFGLWCAIAIHDTSSVVGAAAKYGSAALAVATTVKLARALWILPVSLGASVAFKNKGNNVKIPCFIGFFVIALLLNTYIPRVHSIAPYVVQVSKAALTLTLFLIGCGLTAKVVKSVGVRPFIQGVLLWFAIAGGSLYVIMHVAA